MRRRVAALAALAATLAIGTALRSGTVGVMSYDQFGAIPQPPPPRTIAYGPDPLQHVELWRPGGQGPFPVVLMVHGGCWQSGIARAAIMHAAAADLMTRGIAVWNVEYRGVDVPGGGYPGTFEDVAAAADLLARDGPGLGLATGHVVAVGHSAGGHLALWLAARPRIPVASPLHDAAPLPIAGVVSQGGLPDLARARTESVAACGPDTVDRLTGPPTPARRDVYADTSPAAMLPLGVPATLVSGAADDIAPPRYAENYAARARAAGDRITLVTVPAQGHFELIAPGKPAWDAVVTATRALLAAQPRPR